MSKAPSNWDFVRHILRRLAEGLVVVILLLVACAVVGTTVAWPISYFAGIPFWKAVWIAFASVVSLLMAVSIVLPKVKDMQRAARLRRLRCESCGEHLGKPAGWAGGGGMPPRYSCAKCGAWTEDASER